MTASPPAPKRPKAPLTAALVLLLAVLAGGVAGIALDRLVLLPRLYRPGRELGMHRSPPRDREFRNRFAREVGLTEEQQQRVDSIMDRQGRELRAVRGQVQPQLDSIIRRTRRELDAVLTPDQRQKAEEIRRGHSRRRGQPWGEPPPDRPEEPPRGPPPH